MTPALPVKPIDTEKFAERLRARAINVQERKILISRLSGSDQEVDLTAPTNCDGYGRIRHFKFQTSENWPPNPLPIIPACSALGIVEPPAMMTAQVFQNAACAWRCWYCFVPDALLKADLARSSWFSADELVKLYAEIPERPTVIDLSGGSPDLVPEWTPWMMRALKDRGLDQSTYLWTDDNLSTTYLFDKLTTDDLALLRSYRNYGRVCCFKGFDPYSFAFNTKAAESDFANQFAIMRRLLDLGLDLYGYVTLTSPRGQGVAAGVRSLVDRLQELDPHLPLRTIPLEIRVFSPVGARLAANDERQISLAVQQDAIAAWNEEIEKRFNVEMRALPIASVPLEIRGVR
ncbi:radical SAM protein [Rhizobium calliandrae]|uniref:Radical SAM protein n=1 Tax=Rhizobium calliandrae TaxID=1312182 RepID=A0ABT7KPJ4_9HYPH|nr:radical SAM protein [Rhizobium calliandrae]MDL2409174.1 radical SAM protein [Rhizobium calliandrae]